MTAKQICCCIMICQMTAILSGVSMLYLAVIVVIPSKTELESGFIDEPVMCTTVRSLDITYGGKIKDNCNEFSCGEWCLSKVSSPCIQITVMPRINGSHFELEGCTDFTDTQCSALNVSLTPERSCKLGHCDTMSGLFNCTKVDLNPCREITPAYECNKPGPPLEDAIDCNEKKCESRLEGVYSCAEGQCRKIPSVKDYTECTRKCEKLDFQKPNVIIFGKERLLTAKCGATSSSDNNTIKTLNSNSRWQGGTEVLLTSCTYIDKRTNDGIIRLGDCFNATVADASRIRSETSYLNLLRTAQKAYTKGQWLIQPEETLRIGNDTLLKINPEGCVNTLMKECTEFFRTHDTDGHDGKTPDRYECFYSNIVQTFVIGKYNPHHTFIFMMVASLLPACLFVVSCFCLFICSKSIGVDDTGQLKVVLLKKTDASGIDKNPVHFDELL